MDEIKKTNLVSKANDLLDAITESTNAMEIRTMDEKRFKEMKLVLGFLNACNNVVNTKLKYYKMTGVEEKIKAIKNRSKNL